MRAAVIGAGSWGTALGHVLGSKQIPVTMWAREPGLAAAIGGKHENATYLAGIELPAAMAGTSDLAEALKGAELVVVAVPSHAVRDVMNRAAPFLPSAVPIVSATKGVENES